MGGMYGSARNICQTGRSSRSGGEGKEKVQSVGDQTGQACLAGCTLNYLAGSVLSLVQHGEEGLE
jgi:hypothetical protein